MGFLKRLIKPSQEDKEAKLNKLKQKRAEAEKTGNYYKKLYSERKKISDAKKWKQKAREQKYKPIKQKINSISTGLSNVNKNLNNINKNLNQTINKTKTKRKKSFREYTQPREKKQIDFGW